MRAAPSLAHGLWPRALKRTLAHGLVGAWLTDGTTTSGASGIATLAAALGTSTGLTAANNTTAPTLASGLGPQNQNLAKFVAASGQKFTLASALTVAGSCSVFFAVAPTFASSAMTVLGRSASQSHILLGVNQQKVQVRTTTGGASIDLATGAFVSSNLQIFQVDIDATAQTGIAYVDGIAGTLVSDSRLAGGFTFDQIGAQLTSTNPLGGYVGAVLVFNRVVSAVERAMLTSWLSGRWRGTTIWIDPAGSDSSDTYWNQATPLQTLRNGVNRSATNLYFHGGETIAPKGGAIFRPNGRIQPGSAAPTGTRVTLDGGLWGTGKAIIRYSTAPTPVLVSGTCYKAGALIANKTVSGAANNGVGKIRLTVGDTTGLVNDQFATISGVVGTAEANGAFFITIVDSTHIDLQASTFANAYVSGGSVAVVSTPAAYLFYIPGGTVSVTKTLVAGRVVGASSNIQRIPQDLVMTGDLPATGHWGVTAGGDIRIDLGVALAQGEIELPTPSLLYQCRNLFSGWTWRNMISQFAEDRGWQNEASNVDFIGLEAICCESDGTDGFGAITSFRRIDCFFYLCGRGPTGVGGYGDAISDHDTVNSYNLRCSGIDCDKSGNNGHSGQTSVYDQCFFRGTQPISLTEDPGVYGGSMLMINCIAELTVGAPTPNAAQNTSQGPSTLTLQNCTLRSDSGGTEGVGVFQSNTLAPIVVKNTIIDGFLDGMQEFSGSLVFSHDHNLLHGNGTNYVNTTAGTGELVADPLFTDPAHGDFTVQAGSPCRGAGTDLGIVTDFWGASRPHAPDIGAAAA